MSRHGYSDDLDGRELAMYRGRVASAMRGKRGQKLLRDLRDALDAMSEKKLIAGALETKSGERCALGCVAASRGHDMKAFQERESEVAFDDDDPCAGVVRSLASMLDVSECLIREIAFLNDDLNYFNDGSRWSSMRRWAEQNIREKAKV